MTGEIRPFGEGRKPPLDILARIRAAKAAIPEHDPYQDLLDAQAALVERIDAAGRPAVPDAPVLNDDQVKALTYQTERAAERGVGMYAKRVASWHQAIVGGAFVAGVVIGLVGGWGWRGSKAAAAVTNCIPAPQGSDGEAFSCTFWTRLPTMGSH